jgi:hypothetical protein
MGRLEPCLNSARERVKIAHALHFVIRQLDAEMLFETREHFERLQAVEAKFLVEIVSGRECFSRHFKLPRCQPQDFIGGLLDGSHSSRRLSCAPRLNPFERAR